MPQTAFKSKKRRHQKGIEGLVNRLSKKPNCYEVFWNLEYPLGEFDILYLSKRRYGIYIEYKSNNTEKGYKNARKQLKRGTLYLKMITPAMKWYGVYASPDKIKIVCKDGNERSYR